MNMRSVSEEQAAPASPGHRRWDVFGRRFSSFCSVAALLILFAIMLYLSLIALTETTDMNMNNAMLENVEYHMDNFVFNVLMLLVFALAVFLYRRLVEKVNVWIPMTVCLALVLGLGLIWTFSSLSAPTHDSLIVSRAAYKASIGDYSDITANYFKRFPFQLGYVLFSEIIIRLFHTGENYLAVEVVNVVCLTVSYFALLMSAKRICGDQTVKLCALLLVLCFPPLLFCTFTYGNIPGLMFSCLAVWQFLEIQHRSTGSDIFHATLCALFMGIAVCLKKNCLIFAVAIIILAVIRFVEKRKLAHVLCVLLCVLSIWCCGTAVLSHYERRADFQFGDGIPMVSWLAMGLNESTIAPGWYNGVYTVTNFHNHDMDPTLAAEASREVIAERLKLFSEDKAYANDFFAHKIISQWNEPSYQSLWTNQVRGRYGDMGKLATWACGAGETTVKGFMNLYQQFIFVLTACAALVLIKKKDARTVLLPVIIIGGFLYHALFEAKSQYAIVYFVLMVPLAAYAAEFIFQTVQTALCPGAHRLLEHMKKFRKRNV